MPVASLEADEPRPSLACDRLATARAPAADDHCQDDITSKDYDDNDDCNYYFER